MCSVKLTENQRRRLIEAFENGAIITPQLIEYIQKSQEDRPIQGAFADSHCHKEKQLKQHAQRSLVTDSATDQNPVVLELIDGKLLI